MKLSEILKDITITELSADLDAEFTSICYDSRSAEPGCLFVAVKGYETDGHKFIGSAIEKGASIILCEDAPQQDIPYVRTDNSRRALALASRNFFGDPASKMKLVGVTGTNGKTTSTMLLKHLLETKGEKVGLIGTNQNMIGSEVLPTERTTPESFELQKLFYDMANAGCTYCVMEVSSHSLVLDRVAGINFEVGAFTNLTQDHLDFHKTMDEYARCKALLFNQSKTGVINLDDEWAKFMLSSAECPTMTYSERDKSADVCAEDIALTARNVSFTLSGKRVELGIPGRFSVYNALTVITTGLALGFSLDDCIAALKTANGVKGRVEVVPTDGDYTVLIDYAHTPDALENVIKSMKEVTHGRVVAVFGCGGDRDRTKRPIMGNIAVTNADFAVITSDNPRTEQPDAIIADITAGLPQGCDNYVVIADRTEAIHWAIDNHREGDVIILAGKGHETYQIIGKTKHHMDEREIVAEYLETRKQR